MQPRDALLSRSRCSACALNNRRRAVPSFCSPNACAICRIDRPARRARHTRRAWRKSFVEYWRYPPALPAARGRRPRRSYRRSVAVLTPSRRLASPISTGSNLAISLRSQDTVVRSAAATFHIPTGGRSIEVLNRLGRLRGALGFRRQSGNGEPWGGPRSGRHLRPQPYR